MRGHSIQSAEQLERNPLEVALCRCCGAMCGDRGDSLCGSCWQYVPVYEKRAYMRLWRRVQAKRAEPERLIGAMSALVALARRRK